MSAVTSLERRQLIIAAAAAADPTLSPAAVAAAVDAAITNSAGARELAAALSLDPQALHTGAPPVAGRLVGALRERGSRLPEPTCALCARTGRPLLRSTAGGVCARCRARQLAEPCARCGVIKPVIGRDAEPDICDSCFRLPEAVCSRCQRRRPCSFATGPEPVCTSCAPRRAAACAHCRQSRPPVARWPEGPVCDPCYTAALRRRGSCAGCGQHRRLVDPPGPAATVCADCARQPVSHVCIDCGVEDKLYESGRCNSCALRRRTQVLLRGHDGQIPAALTPVYEAITATATPRTALNWLRKGAGAKVLAELATGQLACTHEALDTHPHHQAADYLRHVLVANGVLPARDEMLASVERLLADILAGISRDADRRLVQAYATWRVLRHLRRSAERRAQPRSHTAHARANIRIAAAFLDWLADHDLTLADTSQADVDTWLTGGPGRYQIRDFLLWAATAGHAHQLTVPTRGRTTGPATSDEHRLTLIARLLHDNDIELTDRVAGALLLLPGQQLSRIAAMTTHQVISRHDKVFVRFGRDDVHIPEPLAGLLLAHTRQRRRYLGVGSPVSSSWLFPGLQPGRPLTAARLGERLRALGIRPQPGRRSAMTHLAAQVPAAVLADLLNLAPTTAVKWVRDAGGDWSRYAAELARAADHQP